MTGNSPNIRAVLFDLDNTLLDRDAAFVSFCRELYHTSGVMEQSHTEAEALSIMNGLDADGYRPRHEFFADVISTWPGVFKDIDQAMQVFLASYPRMAVLEAPMRFLLEDLQERGIPCAIVTNGGSIMQMSKITESGLEGLVDAVVISESLGLRKPDRRIFERALADISAIPSTTMFVGDDPEADILGAKDVGMFTTWVRRERQWPYEDNPPDHIIDHAAEIRPFVLG